MSNSTPSRPSRRSVIAAGAWSVPVIVASVATPAVAASGASPVALSFTAASYALDASCAVLANVRVFAQLEGRPVADGTPVTVTLSEGFTLPDGTALVTVPTVGGYATVPNIRTTASNGDHPITATSGGSTVSASITVSRSVAHWRLGSRDGLQLTYSAVPAAAAGLGANYFLAPDKTLWYSNSPLRTNVQKAVGFTGADGQNNANVLDSSGRWHHYRVQGLLVTWPSALPSTATPLGYNYFLDGTNLYYADDATGPAKIATGVTKALAFVGVDTENRCNALVNGKWSHFEAGSFNVEFAVPKEAVPVSTNYFLHPNGTLYYGFTNTGKITGNPVVATGVKSARGWAGEDTVNRANYLTSAGVWVQARGTQTEAQFPAISKHAEPLGYNFFLENRGDLYAAQNLIASNVGASVTFQGSDKGTKINYLAGDPC